MSTSVTSTLVLRLVGSDLGPKTDSLPCQRVVKSPRTLGPSARLRIETVSTRDVEARLEKWRDTESEG